jgi:hypothetical protein
MLDWRDFVDSGEVVTHRVAKGGERVLAILRREDGNYAYVDLRWFGPWDEGDGPLDDGYWSVDKSSGIFPTALLAERDALSDGYWKSQASE